MTLSTTFWLTRTSLTIDISHLLHPYSKLGSTYLRVQEDSPAASSKTSENGFLKSQQEYQNQGEIIQPTPPAHLEIHCVSARPNCTSCDPRSVPRAVPDSNANSLYYCCRPATRTTSCSSLATHCLHPGSSHRPCVASFMRSCPGSAPTAGRCSRMTRAAG